MTYQDLEEEYNYELQNNRELMCELSELKNKYKEAKKWGYSMRDSAHKFDKELQEFKNKTKNDLQELRNICKDSIVMCEADGTCYLRDGNIMKKINKMIKETE